MKPYRLVLFLSGNRFTPALKRTTRKLITLVLAVLLLFACNPPVPTPDALTPSWLPADAKKLCALSATEFAAWFESGQVTLDGVAKPADSVNFPDGPNCDFYEWSEQMFLWLSSPTPPSYGGGGGRIFAAPVFYDVSLPTRDQNNLVQRTFIPHEIGKPLFFPLRNAQTGPHGLDIVFAESGEMLEVAPPLIAASGNQLVLNQAGEQVEIERATIGDNGEPIFFDEIGDVIPEPRPILPPQVDKTFIIQEFVINPPMLNALPAAPKASVGGTPVFLNASGNVVKLSPGQAGSRNEVLETQTGALVYYTITVNDVFAYFLTGTEHGEIKIGNPPIKPTQFPTTQAELDAIIAFAAKHNTKFPDPEALAVEVKTAWVEADGVPTEWRNNYITMEATIPVYEPAKLPGCVPPSDNARKCDNPYKWLNTGTKTADLALVGMHVVGSTGGDFHSETGITGHPEMIWATFEHVNNTPNAEHKYINTSGKEVTVAQNTAQDWLFCANNCSDPFNIWHMILDKSIPPNIVSVKDSSGNPRFPISPSNTIRWKPWGAASDAAPNPFVSNPAQSNTEVISINNSVRGMLVSGDVRRNYLLIGATWTEAGAPPNGIFHPSACPIPTCNEVGTSQLSNTTMETYDQSKDTSFDAHTNCFACHFGNMLGDRNLTVEIGLSHIYGALKPLFP